MKIFAASALALVLALSGCISMGSAGGFTDRGKLEAAARAFEQGCNSADWDAVAALYTEDATLLAPNMPSVQGRAAIRAFFASFPPISDMRLECKEIRGAGDIAYVVGTYTMMIHAPGAPAVKDSGSFMEIHQRQADGSWPILRDMYHSSLPAE